jgi:hypothetical protein
MSSERAPAESAENAERAVPKCRVPNCWRDAAAVRVVGETVREAILCKRHRRGFFEVSS